MLVEIKKYNRREHVAELVTIRSGNSLDILDAYASMHPALVGTHGDQLLVRFADGATCEVEVTNQDLVRWIAERNGTPSRFQLASGVANFKVVVLDETHGWSPEMIEKAGGKIYASYLFDANQAVNCCELKPSYELIHLFSTPLEDDGQGSVSAEIREALVDNQDKYVHCSSIDSLPPRALVHDFGLDLIDESEEIGLTYEQQREEHREWSEANCGELEFPRAARRMPQL